MDIGSNPYRTDSSVYGAPEPTLGNGGSVGHHPESGGTGNSGIGVGVGIDGYSAFGAAGEFGDGIGNGYGGSSGFEDGGAMDLAMYGEGMGQYELDANGTANGSNFAEIVDVAGGIVSESQYAGAGGDRVFSKRLYSEIGGDNMDVDESPQFTIELELFFDLNKNLVFGTDGLGTGTGTGASAVTGTGTGINASVGGNDDNYKFESDELAAALGMDSVPGNNSNTFSNAQEAPLIFVGSNGNYQLDPLDTDPMAIFAKDFPTEEQFEQQQAAFLRKHDNVTDVLPLPQLQQYVQTQTQMTQPPQSVDHHSKHPFFIQLQHHLQLKLQLPQQVQHQYQQHLQHLGQIIDQRRDSLHEQLAASLLLHGSKRNSLVLHDERGHPHSNSILSQHSQHHSRYKNQLHRESIDSLTQSLHLQDNPQTTNFNELSPLTTTTSLTPSVSSMHSTQPSFLSAQQYFSRNSFDQVPPAPSSARGSLDLYTKNRQSIDSQQSGTHRGRYTNFTTSLYNYFPFRSDRNQLSPVSNSSSPNSPGENLKSPKEVQPPPQQSRMLIRSIFRSQNNAEDASIPRPLEDDIEQEFLIKTEDEPSGSSKKVKKPRRGLFTRFKPVSKDQQLDENTVLESRDSESLDNSNKSISKISSNGDIAPINLSDKLGISGSIKEELEDKNWEPDYAALFQKVGRRKVYPSYKKAAKLNSKTSQENINGSLQNSIGSDESSQMVAIMSNEMALEEIEDDGKSSIAESHTSRNTDLSGVDQLLVTSETSQSNGSTLATASKRILGSKLLLMKKAKDSPVTTAETSQNEGGVEVEVDLTSLKLPANTQIYQTVKSKSKTRGRKENKQADMVDSSKIFLCNYCSRRFKRQEHLKRHFRSLHTYEKPYDCPHCHKKFSRLDNLNLHLKTHKREGDDEEIQDIPEEVMETDTPQLMVKKEVV